MNKYTQKYSLLISAILLISPLVPHNALANSNSQNGAELFKLRKFAQAAEVFEKQIQTPNATASDYYYLGLSYYYKGQRSKTKETFETLIEKFPDSTAATKAKAFLGQSGGNGQSSGSYTSSSKNVNTSANLPRFCRVHYKESSHDIVVDTKVNNKPIAMTFDTGAPDTWIGTNHLISLGIAPPTGPYKMMKSQLGEDKEYKYWSAKIDLKIGQIERKNFPVLVQENRKGTPLVGQTFVEGYKFRIDHSAKELCFELRGEPKSAYKFQPRASNNEVKFETKDSDYIWVTAKVNGKPCKMVFDTGANYVYFPEASASKYGIKVPFNAKVNTYDSSPPSRIATVRRLQLGPIDRYDVEVDVADWANLDQPLLGTSFYKDWEYTIDRERKVIKFMRR